ncbi:hypothetical protein EDB89DRAFT_2196422 [Lactarius sanguifluus]|nr:hypothetical protein EDB89DRAFT_2196422 [Lactarius sanguifluus]
MPSRLCCDTCNPGSFILPVPATVAPKQSRAPNKFKVDSCGYLATELDCKLKQSLRDWRTSELRNLGVTTGNNMFGSQFIMTDEVLDRIVDLSHYEKIDNLATLQSQVSWRNCDRWGPEILIIVKAHAPPVTTPTREALRPAENLPGPSTGHRPSAAPGSVAATPSGSKPRAKSRPACAIIIAATNSGPSVANTRFLSHSHDLPSSSSPTSTPLAALRVVRPRLSVLDTQGHPDARLDPTVPVGGAQQWRVQRQYADLRHVPAAHRVPCRNDGMVFVEVAHRPAQFCDILLTRSIARVIIAKSGIVSTQKYVHGQSAAKSVATISQASSSTGRLLVFTFTT